MSAAILPLSQPPEPARFDAAAVATAVSADMDAIFRDVPAPTLLRPEPLVAPTVLRAPGAARAEPPKRGLRPATVGAIAAAAAIGVAIGALAHAPAPPSVAPISEPASDRAMAALELPASAPLPPEASVAPPKLIQSVARHITTVRPATMRRAAARPAPRMVHVKATASPPSACAFTPDAADCVQDEIAAADRQLRRNYLEAARAGAPLSALRNVRQDWQDLRDQATDDPETVILGYRNLAEDLANETEAAKALKGDRLAGRRSTGSRYEADPSWR